MQPRRRRYTISTDAATLACTVAVLLTGVLCLATINVPSARAAPEVDRPVVVLVHGAWADTSSWAGEVQALQDNGYDVRAIGNPLRGLTGDAGTVAAFLRTIIGPIVLVGHSYGGSVITDAAADIPAVKALVYVDAAAPDIGETTSSLSGADSVLTRRPPSELFESVPDPDGKPGVADLYLKKDVFMEHFGNDLPPATADRLWATQRAASTVAFDTPAANAAWRTIPSWYFISTGDQIITESSQLMMARRAASHVTTFDGGSHLTLVSHPDAVTAVISSAIASVQ